MHNNIYYIKKNIDIFNADAIICINEIEFLEQQGIKFYSHYYNIFIRRAYALQQI